VDDFTAVKFLRGVRLMGHENKSGFSKEHFLRERKPSIVSKLETYLTKK
jgi:hypothetical protein